MKRAFAFSLVLLATSAALTGVAACDGDDDVVIPPYDGSTTPMGESSVPEGGSMMMGDTFVPMGDTGGGDVVTPGVTSAVVKLFDSTANELPDGIAVLNGEIFVSFSTTGAIVNVHPNGTSRPYAQLPVVAGKGKTLGLAFDSAGNLYAAHTASSPPSPVSSPAGIFKIPAGGTDGGIVVGAPWATGSTTAIMKNPNGLAFDDAGNLYVTDATGSIFKIPPAGGAVAAPWSSDAKLGTATACPGGSPVPTGANGIAVDSTAKVVYVTNTDRGAVVSIPVLGTGAADVAADLSVDCAQLKGADGMWLDLRDHSFVVAVNGQNAVRRVSATGSIATIFAGPPLDSPSSIAEVLPATTPENFMVASSAAAAVAEAGAPKPSVIKLTIP